MPLIPNKNEIKPGTMALSDLDNKYVNKGLWSMFDEMRCILIRIVSKPLLKCRPCYSIILNNLFTGIETMENNSVALLLRCLHYMYRNEVNEVWHAYGKGYDQNIVSSLDKMLSYNSIKGLECLIRFIHVIGISALALVDLSFVIKFSFETTRRKFEAQMREKVAEAIDIMIDELKKSRTLVKCPMYKICSGYDERDFYLNSSGERVF